MMYNINSWGSWGPMGFFGLGIIGMTLVAALVLAVLALKGYALWTAAKRDEKGWFIALLLINTFGILELVYLYFFAKVWDKPKQHHSTEHHYS